MTDNNQPSQLDILHRIETLTSDIDGMMKKRGRSVLRRYPLSFALFALFGVVAVSEGVKGILEMFGIFDGHPVYLLIVGLVILVITGSLYKKLDK